MDIAYINGSGDRISVWRIHPSGECSTELSYLLHDHQGSSLSTVGVLAEHGWGMLSRFVPSFGGSVAHVRWVGRD